MSIQDLLNIGKKYGVKSISLGGCNIKLQGNGELGRFRARAHAHLGKNHGSICFLTADIEKLQNNGKPNTLFWHEVAHTYRKSWTHKQVEKWARSQARQESEVIKT